MTDQEIGLATTVLTGAGAGLAIVTRWAVALWATIRREDIAAAKEAATLKREADARMSERHLAAMDRLAIMVDDHTAKDLAAQAEVKIVVARIDAKLDAVIDWRERTPVPPIEESASTRRRTAPHGNRLPPRGGHDD